MFINNLLRKLSSSVFTTEVNCSEIGKELTNLLLSDNSAVDLVLGQIWDLLDNLNP